MRRQQNMMNFFLFWGAKKRAEIVCLFQDHSDITVKEKLSEDEQHEGKKQKSHKN